MNNWWQKLIELIKEWFDKPEPKEEPEPTPEPEVKKSQVFLWKPKSESREGRCAVLLPARIEATDIRVNGEQPVECTGRTNDYRLTYFLAYTGAHYGSNVRVEALNDSEIIETWVVPSGANRFEYRQ